MDGALAGQEVQPGETFVYEFDADPFGLHLYHCHTVPLKRHIHKGLYGTFIVDPRRSGGRPPADEFVMVMNAFDTNFDAENEVYAVNTVANAYMHDPIRVTVGKLVRIYLVNVTEFDPINSLHLHGMFFDVYRTGTSLTPSERTDTMMLCQGERAILETTFRYPGDFMFHAHQSEFAELGWMGLFRRGGAAARDATALAASALDAARAARWRSLRCVIVRSGPADAVRGDNYPPVERLTFQRVTLEPGAIVVNVLNDGPDQVVDRAGAGGRCVLDVYGR